MLINYINTTVSPLLSTNTIATIQRFFSEYSYSHFPVTKEGVYIGCIAKETVMVLNINDTIADYIYELERFYVRNTAVWLDVLEVFATTDTDILPVLDEKNNYLGFYVKQDVEDFFYSTTFLKEKGSVIIVSKGLHSYSIAEITQILESNNAKVIGLFISKTTATSVEVTIKTTSDVLNDSIQTFRRYGYEIVSQHKDDYYLEDLKERSDYLTTYMDV